MDAGVTIKPPSSAVASDYVRPAAVAAQGAATTDLPNSQAVTPGASAGATQNSNPQLPAESSAAYFTHDIILDPQTREVIYRVIDTRTQQVIQQVPDQALLRNRAYSKAMQNGATPFEAQTQADLET